ncbi:restriction endonuclease subunit S [Staphylococcus epidermidis]|nr:restriction endonuclease subunit S [Staphylococcus epidermidis]
MTEQANTPVLRFKSFNDEWSLSTIGALGDFYYGKSAPKWSITEDVGIPCIRYGELYTKFNNVVNEIYSYTSIPKEKLRFSKGGEILIPRVGEDPLDFAKCVYLPQKDIAIGEMISVYNTKENPLFLTYYFNTKMKYEFAKRVEGASVSNLYYSYLEDIKLKIPDIREQEKLGKFFSKLDQQIELEEKKLELLEQQKKGYMQTIFSQGLRFKDEEGNYYKEWDTKQLKDVLEFSNKKTTNENEYPVLTSSRQGLILQSDYYKDGKTFAESNIGYFILPKNYITYRSRSDDGIFKFNLNQIIDVGIISKYYPVFKGINTNQYYLTLHLNYQLKKEYIKYATGTSQLVLSQKNLQNIQTKLPSYEEQTKIANFLSKLDKLIEKQSDKVELLKDHKKGLLQKMFV